MENICNIKGWKNIVVIVLISLLLTCGTVLGCEMPLGTEFKVTVKEDGTGDYTSLSAAEDILYWGGFYLNNNTKIFTGKWDNQQGGPLTDRELITWTDGFGYIIHQTTITESGKDAFLLETILGSSPIDNDTLTGVTSGNSIDVDGASSLARITIEITGEWTSADTPVFINYWTGDEDYYLFVTTTGAARHNGKHISESGGKANSYRIEVLGYSYGITMGGLDNYIHIDGIQVNAEASNTGVGIGAIMNASGVHKISNCIIKRTSGTGWWAAGIGYSTVLNNDLTVYAWNNSVYGFTSHSTQTGIDIYLGTMYLNNNTVFACSLGIYRWSGNVEVINCTVFDITYPGYDIKAIHPNYVKYCATDDVFGTNPIDISPAGEEDGWNAAFVDYANGDVHIKNTDSVLHNAGIDDPGSGLYNDDIDGELRTSPWDVGADELVVYAEERAAFKVIPRTRNFAATERTRDFTAIERTRDFAAIERTRDFTATERTRDFTAIERTRDFVAIERTKAFAAIERTRSFEIIPRTKAFTAIAQSRDFEIIKRTRDFKIIEE